MRRAKILLALGVWAAVLPFLGFPYSYKNVLFSLTGLGLVYFSYNFYKENKKSEVKNFDNFSENNFEEL